MAAATCSARGASARGSSRRFFPPTAPKNKPRRTPPGPIRPRTRCATRARAGTRASLRNRRLSSSPPNTTSVSVPGTTVAVCPRRLCGLRVPAAAVAFSATKVAVSDPVDASVEKSIRETSRNARRRRRRRRRRHRVSRPPRPPGRRSHRTPRGVRPRTAARAPRRHRAPGARPRVQNEKQIRALAEAASGVRAAKHQQLVAQDARRVAVPRRRRWVEHFRPRVRHPDAALQVRYPGVSFFVVVVVAAVVAAGSRAALPRP